MYISRDLLHDSEAALAEFLRPYSVKWLVKEFGCSPDTAKGWKKGGWPNGRAFRAMACYFGPPFSAAVLAPLHEARPDDLASRLLAMRAELGQLISKAQRISAAGLVCLVVWGAYASNAGKMIQVRSPVSSARIVRISGGGSGRKADAA